LNLHRFVYAGIKELLPRRDEEEEEEEEEMVRDSAVYEVDEVDEEQAEGEVHVEGGIIKDALVSCSVDNHLHPGKKLNQILVLLDNSLILFHMIFVNFFTKSSSFK